MATGEITSTLPIIPVAIIGLSEAGKTTFINRLITGNFVNDTKSLKGTFGAKVSYWNYRNEATIQFFDLGGQLSFRSMLWKTYSEMSRGIIYIIDSSNKEKLSEASEWFGKVNNWLTNETDCIAVLFNKWDLESKVSSEEIIDSLNLSQLSPTPGRSFQIFQTSMKTGYNVMKTIDWFLDKVISSENENSVTLRSIYVFEEPNIPILQLMNSESSHDNAELMGGLLNAIEGFFVKTSGSEERLRSLQTEKQSISIVRSTDKRYICAVIIDRGESVVHARVIAEDVLLKIMENMTSKPNPDTIQLSNDIKKYLLRKYRNDMLLWIQ